jgi:hypothetical protein
VQLARPHERAIGLERTGESALEGAVRAARGGSPETDACARGPWIGEA